MLTPLAKRLRKFVEKFNPLGMNEGVAERTRSFRLLLEGRDREQQLAAATYLGDLLKVDIYRVDLSKIISKYIGETEKNIDRIFDQAAMGSFLLFFDEADALFGKRSEVRDSHDRYANVVIAYFLRKLREHRGWSVIAVRDGKNIQSEDAAAFDSKLDVGGSDSDRD